jgi:hypothetical protein
MPHFKAVFTLPVKLNKVIELIEIVRRRLPLGLAIRKPGVLDQA